MELYSHFKKYARQNILNIVILGALTFLALAEVSQFMMIGSLYSVITLDKSNLVDYKDQNIQNLQENEQRIRGIIDGKEKKLLYEMDLINMELHSRIDILDSAIKPEEKRRMLITKVRNAITENTKTKLTIRELNNIAIAIIDYSYQYNLSVSKVLAQIRVESNFNTRAKSKAGALGLMQIMPHTLRYIELKMGKRLNPFNIYNNIQAGTYYMAEQISDFDNYDLALSSYNAGPNNIEKYLVGKYKLQDETIEYVPKIKKWTKKFEKYGLE